MQGVSRAAEALAGLRSRGVPAVSQALEARQAVGRGAAQVKVLEGGQAVQVHQKATVAGAAAIVQATRAHPRVMEGGLAAVQAVPVLRQVQVGEEAALVVQVQGVFRVPTLQPGRLSTARAAEQVHQRVHICKVPTISKLQQVITIPTSKI